MEAGDAFETFRWTLGIAARMWKSADPEARGCDRANQRLLQKELPSRRCFENVPTSNSQLTSWLGRASNRVDATTDVRAVGAESGSEVMLVRPRNFLYVGSTKRSSRGDN